MGAAIVLRADYNGAVLRRLARSTRNAKQARRLLALAPIYDGGSVRDWVARFNARGPPGWWMARRLGSRVSSTMRSSGRLRRFARAAGEDLGAPRAGHRDRYLVPEPAPDVIRGRGPEWPEEKNHKALGQARNQALGAARSADRLDLHLQRHLLQPRQGRGPRLSLLQHRSHEPASRRDRLRRSTRRARCAAHGQAGWHTTGKLNLPSTITIVPLPPKCPEFNPVENIRDFIRDNWLSNRIFTFYDDIVDHCCEAWNKLIDQPWRIEGADRMQQVDLAKCRPVNISKGRSTQRTS